MFTAANPEQATLVRQMLEDAGIRAAVQGSALWGIIGDIPPWNMRPTIWVSSDEDYVKACAIIGQYAPPEPAPTHCEVCGYCLTGLPEPRCPECGTTFYRPQLPEGSDWVCPQCGEKLRRQFTDCWKCGHERPAAPLPESGADDV